MPTRPGSRERSSRGPPERVSCSLIVRTPPNLACVYDPARMTLLQALALVAAGLAAGTTSAMAGGASIITFPVLLAMGVPPLTANVTNTVGLAPIVIGAGLGSAPELQGQRPRLRRLRAAAGVRAGGGPGAAVV